MKNGVMDFPASTRIEWTNGTGADVASGQVVQVGSGLGLALVSIAAAASGIVLTVGRVRVPKTTGSGNSFAVGDAVDFDLANQQAVKPLTGEFRRLGTCAEAAGETDEYVDVNLDGQGANVFRARHIVSSAEAALNSNNGQVDIDTGFGSSEFVAVSLVKGVGAVTKTGYVIGNLTGVDAGKVRLTGVNASTQLDANDIIELIAVR